MHRIQREVTAKKLSEQEIEELELPEEYSSTEYTYEFTIENTTLASQNMQSAKNDSNKAIKLRFPLPRVEEEDIFLLSHYEGENWENVSFKKMDIHLPKWIHLAFSAGYRININLLKTWI